MWLIWTSCKIYLFDSLFDLIYNESQIWNLKPILHNEIVSPSLSWNLSLMMKGYTYVIHYLLDCTNYKIYITIETNIGKINKLYGCLYFCYFFQINILPLVCMY